MSVWKTRLIVIGFINAIIGVIFGVVRGFSELIIGYACVGIIVTVVGIAWNPKEKADET